MTVREHPEATPSVNALIRYLREQDSYEAHRWLTLVRASFRSGHSDIRGAMSGWFKVHNHAQVEVLQAEFDSANHVSRLWMPGSRRADWNPMGVRFYAADNKYSDRRFRGVVMISLAEDTFVGFDRDFLQVLVFHVVDEPRKV